MRFPYQAYPLDPPDFLTGEDALYRPVLPVALAYQGATLGGETIQALVDSGSDWCLFHAVIGTALGVPVRKGMKHRFVGVEGVWNIAYFHEVQIALGSLRTTVLAGFVEDWKFPWGILGQYGLFDRFVVTLHNGRIERYVDISLPGESI